MKIIDLFAGCGGLSKGFEMANFKTVGFVEKWKPAIETYNLNLPKTKFLGEDIRKIDEKKIQQFTKNIGNIDGIVGGPSCQGFSTIGKRDVNDSRNLLFNDFIRFVKVFNPKFVVIENVKGILSMKTKDEFLVKNLIVESLKDLNYNTNILILNAADYGVPQMRNRVFFIAHKEKIIKSPPITHFPMNYVTLKDAISDLPPIKDDEVGFEKINYLKKTIYNHQIKKTNKLDFERAKYIPEGRYLRNTKSGLKNDIFPSKKLHMKESTIRQQKFCRLDRNKPSWTVVTDWYNIRQKVHYNQNRAFSVREVARIQSFPDDFIFKGSIYDMYKMIGNAVPPILAYNIAKSIKECN